MTDYISREAALDAINAYLRLSEMSKTVQNSTTIQEIIASLPSVQPRWMPVTERLPESDDFVCVTIKDESADSPYVYATFGWYLDFPNYWIVDNERRTDVIAWMPLPEPWKGDK